MVSDLFKRNKTLAKECAAWRKWAENAAQGHNIGKEKVQSAVAETGEISELES